MTVGRGRPAFDRRTFIELAAVASAGAVTAGCITQQEEPPEEPSDDSGATTTTQAPTPGTVEPGEEGIEIDIDGETYTLPCGSPIPDGAVCTCNCVDVPSCSCVGDTGCSCVGDSGCSTVSHYWYPN